MITAMLSLLVILTIMITVMNVANIISMFRDADNQLSILADNDGFFPGMLDFVPSGVPANAPGNAPTGPKDPFQLQRLNNTRSMEMPFQARFFWVKIDSDGNISESFIDRIASVTTEEAGKYALAVRSRGKEKGLYHSFRYRVSQKDDGSELYIFVDLSTQILRAYTLLAQTVLIGALTLVAMFILVYLFSGKAVAPVVESLEKQKQFITDAGHELKTPLAVISANVDVMELEGGKTQWTDSTKNQVKRMNALVKNLLTLSRMSEESTASVFEDTDLSGIVKEVAGSFDTLAASKGKLYETDITEGIHVTGDRNALNQLTAILIDNAIKYSSDKGNIKVSLSKEKSIKLEVSNTCDQLPSGNLDRLFDRFYRADSSRSRETGGYGIGLSVARAITDSHHGSIKALKEGDDIIRFVAEFPHHKA